MNERKVPFVNIARFRGVERQLDRIATALENLLRYQYGYHTTPAKAVTTGESPDVSYSSDLDTAVEELEAAYRGKVVEEAE